MPFSLLWSFIHFIYIELHHVIIHSGSRNLFHPPKKCDEMARGKTNKYKIYEQNSGKADEIVEMQEPDSLRSGSQSLAYYSHLALMLLGMQGTSSGFHEANNPLCWSLWLQNYLQECPDMMSSFQRQTERDLQKLDVISRCFCKQSTESATLNKSL